MRRILPGPGLRRLVQGGAILGVLLMLAAAGVALGQRASSGPQASSDPLGESDASSGQSDGVAGELSSVVEELRSAAVRLPLAAALGAVLALRPRRRGTPMRDAAVVQTQIVLATIGGVIMVIVGASLPRAFAIVGVASLVRYRSKVKNPKDAVVMLAALAVGLAAGVGLVALAVSSTLFLVGLLWLIESFEPRTRVFELKVKLGEKTAELRPRIEAVLRSFKVAYELRAVSAAEASYRVTTPHAIRTDRASRALTSLVPDDQGAVHWNEKARTQSE